MWYKVKNSNPLHSFHLLKMVIICTPSWHKVGYIIFLSTHLHSFCHIQCTASTNSAQFPLHSTILQTSQTLCRRSVSTMQKLYYMMLHSKPTLWSVQPSSCFKSDIWLLGHKMKSIPEAVSLSSQYTVAIIHLFLINAK